MLFDLYGFWKRNRSYLLCTAAAGAAAIGYFWWTGSTNPRPANEQAHTGSHRHGKHKHKHHSKSVEKSLLQHFNYIQEVSTPMELQQHVAQVRTLLFELTDPNLLNKYDNALLEPSAPALSAEQKLRFLAKVSFARTISACWLLPLLDLYVRVKVNLIGRHMFLQQKLGSMPLALLEQRLQVQPRMPSSVIDSFLGTSHLMHTTAGWIVQRTMEAVEQELLTCSFDAPYTPDELGALICRMMTHTEEALRPPEDATWGQLILGPKAGSLFDRQQAHLETYRSAMVSALALEDLNHQLSDLLNCDLFADALAETVSHTFSLISQAIVENVGTMAGSQPALIDHAANPKQPVARPLARLLKPVQASCLPFLQDPKHFSQGLASFTTTKALAAAAFAAV